MQIVLYKSIGALLNLCSLLKLAAILYQVLLSFQTNCGQLHCRNDYTGLSHGVVVLDGTTCGPLKVRRYIFPTGHSF